MSTAPPQLFNVRETARRLGVHENTVRNWADRGILRAIRLPGSGYRPFAAEDVDRIAPYAAVQSGRSQFSSGRVGR